jgi:hypothetical protein
MLSPEGVSNGEVLGYTGWPSVSMPQQARQCFSQALSTGAYTYYSIEQNENGELRHYVRRVEPETVTAAGQGLPPAQPPSPSPPPPPFRERMALLFRRTLGSLRLRASGFQQGQENRR